MQRLRLVLPHGEICHIGARFFPDTPAPCPAIIYVDGKVRCGFVLGEIELMKQGKMIEPKVQEMLGTGMGCDADDL